MVTTAVVLFVMVFIVMVTTAVVLFVMVFIVMVTAAVVLFVVMFIVMVTAAVVLFVMVFIVMVTAAVVLFVVMMLLFQLRQFSSQRGFPLHSFHQLCAGQLIPGSGNNGGVIIMLPQHCNCGIQLLLVHSVGTGKNDGSCSLDLIIIELTKVLHIDLYLVGIHHRYGAIQLHLIIGHFFNRCHNIGQFTHTGGFDHDAIRRIIGNYLCQSSSEIAHQAAADTSGIHFRNVDTGILQETAIDTDLAEFIFDQNQFLTCIAFRNQFLDQCGFSRSQKAGEYINFRHLQHLLYKFLPALYHRKPILTSRKKRRASTGFPCIPPSSALCLMQADILPECDTRHRRCASPTQRRLIIESESAESFPHPVPLLNDWHFRWQPP